jgi:hypothetical protein
MKIRGWVYLMTNEAMPGLVKVGYSTKDPALRARELEHTGSPHPYEVVYDRLVINPREVEQRVHKALDEVREGKEWFRCSVITAKSRLDAVIQSNPYSSANDKVHEGTAKPPEVTEDKGPVPCILKGYGCTRTATNEYMGYMYCQEHFREVQSPPCQTEVRHLSLRV